MNELALFAGAGGGILGGHLLGWRTVCAVERDAYAAQVLAQRQNDRILRPFPIWSDVISFDGKPWRGIVDVVSGGFPCQDISSAGRGAGIEGERSGLWKHMARIISEVRPHFVFVENSPLLTGRGLALVISDLAEIGYDCQWSRISAEECGRIIREIVSGWSGEKFATPQARDYRSGSLARWNDTRRSRNLNDQVGGLLNPNWIEWLMGWPEGWTELKPLAMDKFREWQQQHSHC